ncbi:MAG: hypothetical protein KDC38_17385 [Planctomycetes bacterium]|nr:hypothetical protein [Planctomycetota bacterium]
MFGHYGLRGFPTMLILDSDGEVLHGKAVGFRASNERALRDGLARVEPLFAARRAAASAEATELDRARLALIEGLRKPSKADFDAMERAAKVKGIDPELVAEFEPIRLRGPYALIYGAYTAKARNAGKDRSAKLEARQEAIAKTYAIYQRGHTIDDRSSDLHRSFWILAFDGAIEARNRGLAERAFEEYRATYGEHPTYKTHVEPMKAKLEKLGTE